jgi:hypothetical protein
MKKIENIIKVLVLLSLVIIIISSCSEEIKKDPYAITPSVTILKQTEAQNTHKYSESFQKEIATISAVELSKDYLENEITADNKYLDEMIIVSGKIYEVSKELGTVYIKLEGAEYEQVSCQMIAEQENFVAKLKVGDRINIQGLCAGYDSVYINLEECILKGD